MSLSSVVTPESCKEPGEMGVGHFVVDDESGVDRHCPVAGFDLDRVGVTAKALVGLVDHDLVVLVQGPCCAQPRDAGTDHGNSLSHAGSSERSMCPDDKIARTSRPSASASRAE